MDSLLRGLGISERRLIAYGAGMAFLQMQTVMPLALDYIVDNAPGLAGKEIMGFPVFHSSRLMTERNNDPMIIIFANTAPAILSIAQSLNSMGFVSGKDYIDCSVLQRQTMKARMQDALGIRTSEELFRRIRLLSLYNSIQCHSTIAGTWLFAELLESMRCLGGIAECGVYSGGNAFISLLCSAKAAERPYHLLDSFEGFPELSQYDPSSRKFEFKDISFPYIRDIFRNFENVRIHKGYFTETLPSLSAERFALVYVDCDLYEPTLELCEFFYPRLADGGCLLFHDYWVPENDPPHLREPYFRGVNRAVGEFLGPEVQRLVVFPETTHAVFVK
jgi:O-methyltransferase